MARKNNTSNKKSHVASAAALVLLAVGGTAAVQHGWQYGSEPVSGAYVKPGAEPASLFIPGPPVAENPGNPLLPSLGKAVALGKSYLKGVFKEFEPETMRQTEFEALSSSYINGTLHNFVQAVKPVGATAAIVTEYQFNNGPTVNDKLDKYLKALVQVDKVQGDYPGSFRLGTNWHPGSKFYKCAKTNGGNQCYKNALSKRMTGGESEVVAEEADVVDAAASDEHVEGHGDLDKRYIFGTDDRHRISSGSRTSVPYRYVGIVGNHCTGTLVGPRHVLTAGHCVHSGPGGDWIADLSFRPAYDEDAATKSPYGKFEWARATTKVAWTRDGNWAWDYAIIELSTDTGLGWMSFGWHSGLSAGWNFNLNGYPGSTLWGRMYHSYGSALSAATETFAYRQIDMVKGHSGSGVYLYDGGSSRIIYGVNNVQYWSSGDAKPSTDNYGSGHTSPSWNQAVRITSYKFTNICGWINDFAALGC